MSTDPVPLTLEQFCKRAGEGVVEDFTLGPNLDMDRTEMRVSARNGRCIGIDFSQWVLAGSHFEHVDFEDCRFRAADLSACRFERCTFFTGDAPSTCDFSFADLRETVFDRCDLTTAVFIRTRAYGLELNQCQAQGIELRGADFSLAVPVGLRSEVNHATFDGCNLSYADFSATDLTGCQLTDNRLIHSIWHNAVLERANLAGSTLDNIEGKGLVLRGADLRGCQFNNLDARQIDLTDVQVELEQGLTLLQTLGIVVS
jgi:fluoroquinolone resistance protein